MTHRDSHTRGVTAIVVGLNPQPKDSRSDRSEQVRFFLSSLAAEGDSLSNNSGQNRTIPVAPELFARINDYSLASQARFRILIRW